MTKKLRRKKKFISSSDQQGLFEVGKKTRSIRVKDELWFKFKIEVFKDHSTIEDVLHGVLTDWLKGRGV